MKWYERFYMKAYIYVKTFLWFIYFLFVGQWFIKIDEELQKEEDEELLKLYKEAKENKITDIPN